MKLRFLTLAFVTLASSQVLAVQSTLHLNHTHYDTPPALKCSFADTPTSGTVSGSVRLGYVSCKNSIKGQTYSLVSTNNQKLLLRGGEDSDVWQYDILDSTGKVLANTDELLQTQVEYLAVATAGETTPKGGVWQDTWTLDVVTN